jgi:hypothetical protein
MRMPAMGPISRHSFRPALAATLGLVHTSKALIRWHAAAVHRTRSSHCGSQGDSPADQARIGEVWKDHIPGTATRVTSAMPLLHVRHNLFAEEQLTHSLLCPALSDDVIGHGDEITTSALER